MITQISLLTLALTGFLIALYFTLVYYGKLQPDAAFIPSVCRVEKRTCLSIIHTRESRVFGIQNSLLGLAYYILVGWFAITLPQHPENFLVLILTMISAGTVALGIYLSYSLLVKLRTACPLCFAGHIINLIIFLILLSINLKD